MARSTASSHPVFKLQARYPLEPQMARDNLGMNDPTARTEQPRNPLHGVTLEAMVRSLEAHYGWEELARQIPVRCFSHDPSVSSSLKFLRKTPWARDKVESLYLFMLREQARRERASGRG
jgi:uncharacterized protein (DUF2132 family)